MGEDNLILGGLVLDGEDLPLLHLLLALLPHQNSNGQEVSKDCQKGGGLIMLIRSDQIRVDYANG